jgi:hypothetical protein
MGNSEPTDDDLRTHMEERWYNDSGRDDLLPRNKETGRCAALGRPLGHNEPFRWVGHTE